MDKKIWFSLLLVFVLALSLVACDQDDDKPDSPPDNSPAATAEELTGAARGEYTFLNAGCTACHALDREEPLSGPSMPGIATVAGTRVPGQDAAAYLRESIVAPETYVVEGYDPIMPPYPTMTERDLDGLVAFLLTLVD